MQRLPGFTVWGVSLLLYSGAVMADDSSAALQAGGIVFTRSGDIRMADEDLLISPKTVRIRFAFANDSSNDVDTMIAFPLPDIDTGEFSQSALGTVTADPVNFVGFAVKADGRPIKTSVEQRAFVKNRDVTAIIRSVGLPINVVSQAGFEMLRALPTGKRKMLIAAGLADFDEYNNVYPHWIVRTRFYWRQRFPARKTVVLEQSYQPVTGQSFFTGMELNGESDDSGYYEKTFCLDARARATLGKMIAADRKANPSEGGLLNAYTTEYVLRTGNNWKGPIGRFHLTLDKLEPDNILSLCWDGILKKTGATTFEDTRANFTPAADIKMLVLGTRPRNR